MTNVITCPVDKINHKFANGLDSIPANYLVLELTEKEIKAQKMFDI